MGRIMSSSAGVTMHMPHVPKCSFGGQWSPFTLSLNGFHLLKRTIARKIVRVATAGSLAMKTNLYTPQSLTASFPLKHDGWKMSLSFWDGKFSGAKLLVSESKEIICAHLIHTTSYCTCWDLCFFSHVFGIWFQCFHQKVPFLEVIL